MTYSAIWRATWGVQSVSELLIALTCLFGPMLIVGFVGPLIFQRKQAAQEEDTLFWRLPREEDPAYQSALASIKIMDMTVTNNDSPAFGSTFFDDLEKGLRRLNQEGREVP